MDSNLITAIATLIGAIAALLKVIMSYFKDKK
jgi:hypothetical protein